MPQATRDSRLERGRHLADYCTHLLVHIWLRLEWCVVLGVLVLGVVLSSPGLGTGGKLQKSVTEASQGQ